MPTFPAASAMVMASICNSVDCVASPSSTMYVATYLAPSSIAIQVMGFAL